MKKSVLKKLVLKQQKIIVIILFFLMLTACSYKNKETLAVADKIIVAEQLHHAEDWLIVDCLLPGQVRRLGLQANYLTQRRPLKTSALDCRIRGGEYVAYDRANLQTALKVWLPLAEKGEGDAQYYVGEMYERGLGVLGRVPDYQKAVFWYQAAAEKNIKKAQINLGVLYEKGLGVEKQPELALEMYRKGLGVTHDKVVFSSSVESVFQAKEAQIEQVRHRVEMLQNEKRQLQNKNKILTDRIAEKRVDLALKKQEEEKLQEEIVRLKHADIAEQKMRGIQKEQDQEIRSLSREYQKIMQHKNKRIEQLEQALHKNREQASSAQSLLLGLKEEEGKVFQEIALKNKDIISFNFPSIQLIDPPLITTRGKVVVTVSHDIMQADIIGKVDAPAGITSLTINEVPLSLDEYHLFWVNVPVKNTENLIKIDVVDAKNRKVNLSFSLLKAEKALEIKEDKPLIAGSLGHENLGQFHALIIGNNDYQHFPGLKTAVNDARDIEKVLREKYGFKTVVMLNATHLALLSQLEFFRKNLKEDDNFLVYYAGHGELDNDSGEGYWLPVDADEKNKDRWVANKALSDMIQTLPAKHVLVVADSCYAGTLSVTSIPRAQFSNDPAIKASWLKVLAEVRSRTVLTSGGIAPVYDDFTGSHHSVFAQLFLDVLSENTLTIEGYEIYKNVLVKIKQKKWKDFHQVPAYAPIKFAGHEAGEFLLSPI